MGFEEDEKSGEGEFEEGRVCEESIFGNGKTNGLSNEHEENIGCLENGLAIGQKGQNHFKGKRAGANAEGRQIVNCFLFGCVGATNGKCLLILDR